MSVGDYTALVIYLVGSNRAWELAHGINGLN